MTSISSINSFPTTSAWNPINRDTQQNVDGTKPNNHFQHDRVHEHGKTQDISTQEHRRPVSQVDNNNTQVTDANQAAGAALAYQGVSASISSGFDMQVTTKEGDVVTIGFNASASQIQSAMQVQDANGPRSGTDAENTQNSAFNISVQGNLSDAEKKSLGDLLQQIQQVGSSFFQGQTQNAFQQAQNVGFDAGQIAGFSMSMNLEMSVQAVSAYQQNNTSPSTDAGALKQMAGFFNQSLQNLSDAPQALQPFTNPQDIFNSLTTGVSNAVASQTPSNANTSQPLDMLHQLMQMMGSLLFDTNNHSGQQLNASDPAALAATVPTATADPSATVPDTTGQNNTAANPPAAVTADQAAVTDPTAASTVEQQSKVLL